MKLNSNKYALLMVFDYQKIDIPSPPKPLLSMDIDLFRAYELANTRFGIPKDNITIITDVKTQKVKPWEPLIENQPNPEIVKLEYPNISDVIKELVIFIENTVRGIEEISLKGSDQKSEVFLYFSCHGVRLNMLDSEIDSALMLLSQNERRYLRSDTIFNLFFGNQQTVDGILSVPITSQVCSPSKVYNDLEISECSITPSKYNLSLGLPKDTSMLVIFDTCHSGTMASFNYIYDVSSNKMIDSKKHQLENQPYCVSISASQDSSNAISTINGSLFTESLFAILNKVDRKINIQELNHLIYENIPNAVKLCKPTICSTVNDVERTIPFL